MAMDSFTKPQGVPVSAAQASPKASLLSSSSGSSSFPIRAPLTIDSDSDASGYGSDKGFESDGVLSDEVKFGNVLEKSVVLEPFVTTPNEETSEESVGSGTVEIIVPKKISEESIGNSNVEKTIVSKSSVTPPNGKGSEEKESSSGSSSSVEKNVFSGLNVSIPDRIITMKRVLSRRFLAVNGESLASPLVDEGGKNVGGETKIVDETVASPGILSIATIPLVKEDDGKVVGGDEAFVVSRPFATNPNGNNREEKESSSIGSSNVEKKAVSGPYLSIPDNKITLNRVVSRRFLAVNGESLVSPLVAEEYVKDVGGKTKLVDDILSSSPSSGITPVAKLSEDSDEDSVGNVFEEDDGFSGVARIQFPETLEKLSTLEGQVLGVGDGDENKLQFKSVLESDVLEGLVSSKHLNAVLVGDKYMSIVESDSIQNDNIGDLVKDEGPHIGEDAKATSLVKSEVSLMLGSSAVDEIAEYSVEEIHGLENMEQVAELYDMDSIDTDHNVSVVCTSTTEGETAVDSFKGKEVVEGGQTEDAGIDDSSSAIYYHIDTLHLETDKVVDSTVEFVDITESGMKAVRTVEEENVSETQEEDVHEPGGKCDKKDSVYKENAEANEDVNVNAICLYDLNCGINGGHANESKIFSQESKSDEMEIVMEQDTDFSDAPIPRRSESGLLEDELCCKSSIHQPGSLGSNSEHLEVKNKNEVAHNLVQSKEEEGSCSKDYVEDLKLGEFNTLENIPCEMEVENTSHSISGGDGSYDHSKTISEHFVTYFDEDADLPEESGREVLFDSASFSGLPDVDRGSVTSVAIMFSDDSGLLSLENSADLNSNISPTKPTSQTDHLILSSSTELAHRRILAEEEINKLNVQLIRAKYLRLVQRLGLSAENSIAAQVSYWMDLAIRRSSSLGFSRETVERETLEFEANDKDLDCSLNILIIGKSGVGKSATINSIFGEEKIIIDPFGPATTIVKEIVGTIDGIKLRVLDTPGFGTSLKDQSLNKKILKSIGKFMKGCPPDVVIYVDRLDMQSQDLSDLQLLRSITGSLGSSLWHKTFITLTHAASTPPDGPSGEPLSYEKVVALRSHVIQQAISHAIGEQNMINAGTVNPVCLVENQGLCKKSRDGQAWKPQLLLLCYSMKILSELKSTIKAYKTLDVSKMFNFLVPSEPLPRSLSSSLQSCDHLQFSADQSEEATFGKGTVLVGRNTKLVMCAGLNDISEVSVKISSSEQLHIPLMVLLSIVHGIFSKLFPNVGKGY